jgi:hypothetical protein
MGRIWFISAGVESQLRYRLNFAALRGNHARFLTFISVFSFDFAQLTAASATRFAAILLLHMLPIAI